MDCRFFTFIVRTLHNNAGSTNAFIAPVEIEAPDMETAARKRFDMLSTGEQRGCRALLVERKLAGSPHLFEVKAVTVPSYTIKPA